MCLYPKIIKNRKYLPNKKNYGCPPEIKDKRTEYVPVGCGKCIECMKQKARTWQIRLSEDIKEHKNGVFVTLTFSNDSIAELCHDIKLSGYELDNEISKIAVRRFLERWRKKHKKSVRHWLVTELGHEGTENIHMHGIIYTDHVEDIESIWKYGYVFKGTYVNQKTINYIIKYITKTDKDHKYYVSKILSSPGIGRRYVDKELYINRYKGEKTNETYKNSQGYKMALPIYYRNHIYNEEEKEALWIAKLNLETRYVCGEKIDISKGDEEYYKSLDYYRRKNKELGYSDNSVNWERKKYENQRRNLMTKKRLDTIIK